MNETKQELVMVVATPSAVGDGYVDFTVDRTSAWIDPASNYSKARVGFNLLPVTNLTLRIPVEGAKVGQPITPEDMAVILQTALAMNLPACKMFIGAASGDFGYTPPPEEPEEDF